MDRCIYKWIVLAWRASRSFNSWMPHNQLSKLMSHEPEELTEARHLLAKFEAQMGRPEGFVYLNDALPLLASACENAEFPGADQIASNIAAAYLRKVQAAVEEMLVCEPLVHTETVDQWQKVFNRFELSAFPFPKEVAETRSKLVLRKLKQNLKLLTREERREFLERLKAELDGSGI